MITIETPRLLIRPFLETDTDDVFAYAQDPDVGPRAGWKPHENIDETARIVRMFIQDGDVWAIELRESGRVIGSIGLHRDSRRNHPSARMIGYVLAKPYWGRGLMPECVAAMLRHAFCTLDMLIVSAVYFPFNLQSRRVMEKCGMRHEGTLRLASRLFNGEYFDDVCYSITREEYFSGGHADRQADNG